MHPRTALLACTLLILGASPPLAAQEPGKEPWKYHEPFQGAPRQAKDFELLGHAAECVKYEAEGLRITQPVGKGRPVTGIATKFGLKGDFDVSVRYEILQEPEPADAGSPNTGTRLSLTLKLDERNEASIRRKITPATPVHILTWQMIRPAGEAKPLQKGANFRVTQKSGRLRMERKGTDLSYYLADGDDKDFKLLTTFPFVADDIQTIQLFGQVTSPKAALDARFSDLHITATSLAPKAAAPIEPMPKTFGPNKPAPKIAPQPAPAPPPTNPPNAAPPAETQSAMPLTLLIVLGSVLAIATAIVVGVVIVVMLRARNDAG